MADSLGKLCNAFHVVKPLRKFVRHRLPFCHAHQPASSAFGHCSLTPHFENHLVRANPQAKQVIVISVQPNMVELESAVRTKRSRFHFKSCISDPKVRGRNSPSIANCYVILAQEAPYEFLANLAAVGIAKHPVSYQRRVAPDVFRRVFPDDGHQQVHWVHAGGSQMLLPEPLFQNTRKYEWFFLACTWRTVRLTPGRFWRTTTNRSSVMNPSRSYDCMIST